MIDPDIRCPVLGVRYNAGELKEAVSYVLEGRVKDGAKGFVDSAEKNVYKPGVDEDKMTCTRCPNGCMLTVLKK